MPMKARRSTSAFTLIELLVVVAIIALLISILLPSLNQARRQARAQVCKANMRSLGQAALTYVTEYGVYPPSLTNYANGLTPSTVALRWEAGKDWLGIGDQAGPYTPGDPANPNSGNPRGFHMAPTLGLLFKTINNEKVYLCPDDKPGPVQQNTLLGGGGNGKFSYTMFSQFGMAAPEKFVTRLADRTSGPSRGAGPTLTRMPPRPMSEAPLFVEEHPTGINAIGPSAQGLNAHMEGNFNTDLDFVVSRHPSGSTRPGIDPVTTQRREFYQESTHIAFADAHVESVRVNYGYGLTDVRPQAAGGQGLPGIPHNANGLLWYYGFEWRESETLSNGTVEYYVVRAK
ncbi:MAG: prepilin-type N-terminal cleavage/methylation domain-containing protein [Phycisphaerales bacterium]|nr:prepilin-type N-terminal cleavage/methylation domain-containing protein [Phycisphaerales bacterium]